MRWMFRVVVALVGLALVGGLVMLFRRHQARLGSQAESEEPVVAPSRVHTIGGETIVVLDSADERRLGLRTAVLRATSRTPELRLTGQLVPEPDRVSAVRAPIAGRLSLPEGARWPRFGDAVRAGTEIAQVSDARPLTVARGGIVTQVGAQPGEMVQGGQLLLEVTDYSQPLARIPWPPDAPNPAARLLLSEANGGDVLRVPARLIGAAPAVDEVTRLPAYLYLAERAWPGARPGAPVTAVVPVGGPLRGGVVVPDAAVVQWQGLAWAYRQRGPGHFARVRVPSDQPVPGGFLAAGAFAPGDTVVVVGAEQLLSEEFRARITVGDEPAE